MNTENSFDLNDCLTKIAAANQAGRLTDGAVDNLKCWLTQSRYAAYAPAIAEHIAAEKWKQLDDVFWTVIPFGTGGRRGMMYPFGSNAINDRTIGESAQGLADYVKRVNPDGPWSIGIAYDTRHRSREFAELCSGIMVANGFEVYFLDQCRSTPELSFLIRHKQCDCGIMVTASHNPPSDNAVKVYWSSGAQLIPPHDQAVIENVNQVDQIETVPFQQAVDDGKVHFVLDEVDAALLEEHKKYSFAGPRDIRVIYSPLHGVGEFNVKTVMTAIGFNDLEIYGPHQQQSGDFPNVPGNVSNPENAAVFDDIIQHAKTQQAELILASDPDCDRMGAAAPLTTDVSGQWAVFNGNQLAVLLGDFVMRKRQAAGTLTDKSYLVTTLVTTKMIARAAQHYDVRCLADNLVGFKWICSVMDIEGPQDFIYGTEESHGYLVGDYARDKDGVVACMLMSELAAEVKAAGRSLWQHLDSLYQQFGYHQERLINIRMTGSDGMKRMEALMAKFRSQPPTTLAGLTVTGVRDYSVMQKMKPDGTREPIDGPQGNLLIFETDQEGNYVAARPSGTEPKIKFYMFTYVPSDQIEDLDAIKQQMPARLDAFADDMNRFADSVQ